MFDDRESGAAKSTERPNRVPDKAFPNGGCGRPTE